MRVEHYSYMQRPATCRRLVWISFSRLITFFIPNFILFHVAGLTTSGKIKQHAFINFFFFFFFFLLTTIIYICIASRNAWREKIALFFLYLFSAALFCFWLEFISSLFCDPEKTYDYEYVFSNESRFTAINGKAVNWHHYSGAPNPIVDYVNNYPHRDLSPNFPKFIMLNRTSPDRGYADAIVNDCIYYQNKGTEADAWLDHLINTDPGYQFQNDELTYCPLPGSVNQTGAPCFYGNDVDTLVDSLTIKGGNPLLRYIYIYVWNFILQTTTF
jgi:hypothetical protein